MRFSTASSAAATVGGASTGPATTALLCLAMWLLPLFLVLQQQEAVECRYLPTRSHGDDLDKLRELMLQILESSNEEPSQQQQRPPNNNDLSGGGGNGNAPHASWLNRLNSLDAVGAGGGTAATARKYGGTRGGYYESGRYY